MTFASGLLAHLRPGEGDAPPRLTVNFFGLLGPNGPLPLHLTEYARDRLRNSDDPTMARFLDLFHHRRNTQDISLGGMRVYSDEDYPVGSRLDLDVLITDQEPVRCWAGPLCR